MRRLGMNNLLAICYDAPLRAEWIGRPDLLTSIDIAADQATLWQIPPKIDQISRTG